MGSFDYWKWLTVDAPEPFLCRILTPWEPQGTKYDPGSWFNTHQVGYSGFTCRCPPGKVVQEPEFGKPLLIL